jgi:hypothetical protein
MLVKVTCTPSRTTNVISQKTCPSLYSALTHPNTRDTFLSEIRRRLTKLLNCNLYCPPPPLCLVHEDCSAVFFYCLHRLFLVWGIASTFMRLQEFRCGRRLGKPCQEFMVLSILVLTALELFSVGSWNELWLLRIFEQWANYANSARPWLTVLHKHKNILLRSYSLCVCLCVCDVHKSSPPLLPLLKPSNPYTYTLIFILILSPHRPTDFLP